MRRVLGWVTLLAMPLGSPADETVARLPPLIVEETVRGHSWLHADVHGAEVLSRCSEEKTMAVLATFSRSQELLRALMPARFLATLEVPATLYLYDEELWPAAAQEAVAEMLRSGVIAAPAGQVARPAPSRDTLVPSLAGFGVPAADVREKTPSAFFPNLMLADTDAIVVFSLVPSLIVDPDAAHFTAGYLGHLLGRRTPPLPAWFVSGLLGLYGRMRFDGDTMSIGPAEWLLAGGNAAELPPIAMETFLTARGGSAQDPQRWSLQAELFVRWGLDPRQAKGADRWWEFVERCCRDVPDEQMVRECFQQDFAELTQTLASYASTAVATPLTWRAARGGGPAAALRPATGVEIARIKGDWERLETDYVRRRLPEFETKYLDQARKTLRRAYDRGARDPQLMAVMGLCEHDAGDDTAARPFLEAALGGTAVRARVYVELARMRLSDDCARSMRNDGKVEFDEVKELLALLAAARTQGPPVAEGYELTAEVWERSVIPPQQDDLLVLTDGVGLFPSHVSLVTRAARLQLNRGAVEEAAALVETGLRHAGNDRGTATLRELQDEIGRVASASPTR